MQAVFFSFGNVYSMMFNDIQCISMLKDDGLLVADVGKPMIDNG